MSRLYACLPSCICKKNIFFNFAPERNFYAFVSFAEGLNVLHDLDSENGANEMNALLSLVISMGHNRVAGALRFDRVDDTPSDSEDEDNDDNDRPGRDSRTDRSETDSRDNRDDRDSRGDRSETESRGDRSETESRDERSETDSRDERLDSSRDEDQYERDTEDKHERGSDKPTRAARVSRDSEDDRRPRRESKGKEDSRHSKRQRWTRGDGPDDLDFFPPCRELLSCRPDEPSTSSKGSQKASGESEQSSSKDNNANSSKVSLFASVFIVQFILACDCYMFVVEAMPISASKLYVSLSLCSSIPIWKSNKMTHQI